MFRLSDTIYRSVVAEVAVSTGKSRTRLELYIFLPIYKSSQVYNWEKVV